MFETDFFALLASGDELQALLGNSASPVSTRSDDTVGIFPAVLPEEAPLPAIEWHIASDRSIDVMEGVNRLSPKRVQINCYANNYLLCKRMADAVKDLIGGFQGELPSGGYLSSVIRNNAPDAFEEKPLIFRTILDYSMMYTAP